MIRVARAVRPLALAVLLASGTTLAAAAAEPTFPPAAATHAEGVSLRFIEGAERGQAGTVDESALRYFASRGDEAAVRSEIARLKSLNPGWQPPADLFGPVDVVDEQPLWGLYKQNDYPGVRAAIERLRAEHPEWSPPAKLVELMASNEAHAELGARSAARDWAGAVAVAARSPSLTTCEHLDDLWRTAEAFHHLGRDGDATALYTRALDSCAGDDQRFATLQKARALLGREGAAGLFAHLAEKPLSPEAQARVAALNRPDPAPRRPAVPPAIYKPVATAADAKAAEAVTISTRDAGAARKIGWLYHDAQDTVAARAWFERAMAWHPDEEAAKGLALSLAADGDLDGLDRLAAAYPAPVGPIREQAQRAQVAKALEVKDLPAVLRLTKGTLAANLVLQRGWALMQLARPTEAQQAFRAAMARADGDENQREEAAYGLARVGLALGAPEEANAIAAAFGLTAAHRMEVRAELITYQATDAFDHADYRGTLALLEQRRQLRAPDRDARLQEAWAYYHLGQLKTAEHIFGQLDQVLSTPESIEGLRVVQAALKPNRS